MDNDFIDQPEGMDDGFETESETVDNLESSASETDRVADILMGGDGGGESSSRSKEFTTRNVDSDGRPSYEGKQAEAPAYAGNQSAPDMQSVQGRIDHYEAQGQAIRRQWDELQQMQGDLTPEQFAYQRDFLQGQAAAAVMQHQQAQIEQMQNQAWLAGEEAKVREKHADIFNDPTKRNIYGKKMVDYLGSIGYSREELADIGAREYNAVLDHIKAVEERDRLKLENAKLKQEHRKRNADLKKGRRDMQGGNRRSSAATTVNDDVARILLSGGK